MASKNDNKIGKWGATSYIIGNIIGSGIFIAPNSIINATGSCIGVALIVWIVSAIISAIGAFCYVELGTRVQRSGADFAYLTYVEWHSVAFAFMCCGCILLYPAILSIQAETFSEYLLQALRIEFCNSQTLFITRKLVSFSLLWLLIFLNFFSVRKFVQKFQIVATCAKIFSSIIIIATGLYVLIFTEKGSQNLENPFNNWREALKPGELISALFAGLFSYDGWDVLNFGLEDLRNPKSTLKFAIVFGMTITGAVFVAMNLSFFIVLNVEQMKNSTAVANIFAQNSLGEWQHVIPLLVSIVLVGSLNSTIFSASRYLFVAGRSGVFPAFISCVNDKHNSPRTAVFFHVLLALAFSFLGNLNELLDYVGFAQWIQRTLTICSLLYIRYKICKSDRVFSEKKDFHKSGGKLERKNSNATLTNFIKYRTLANRAEKEKEILRSPIIIPIIFLGICLLIVFVTMTQKFMEIALISFLVIGIGFVVYFLFIYRECRRLNEYRKNSKIFACFNYFNVRLTLIAQIAFNGIIEVEEDDKSFNETNELFLIKQIDSHKTL